MSNPQPDNTGKDNNTAKDKDDLADALNKLASGEAPSSPGWNSLAPGSSYAIEKSKSTRESRRSALTAAATRIYSESHAVTEPAPQCAGCSTPRAITQAGFEIVVVRAPAERQAASPGAPSTPTLSQPPVQPNRPAAPVPPVDSADISSSLANVIEDDDAVIVPAPEPAVFVPRPAPAPRAPAAPFYTRLAFRRTIIPILLTMGVALPACAIWWLMLDEDAPVRLIGLRFPITLAGVGLVMLVLGILNMIQVKYQLAEAANPPSPR